MLVIWKSCWIVAFCLNLELWLYIVKFERVFTNSKKKQALMETRCNDFFKNIVP